jgi:hypothetical protein
MKKPTAKTTRRAAPRAFLDCHSNVIVAHTGDDAAPLFRHVLPPHSAGTMPAEKVALILGAGLRSVGYSVQVREVGPAA